LASTVCQPAAGLATTYPPASHAPTSVGGGKYAYWFAQVCDAASATDCSVGGGTLLNSCISTGLAWVPSVAIGGGTITGVTAGTGLSGGGTSGSVTVSLTAPVTRALGGLNTTSPGTGILRDGATSSASELSGDCVTIGSNSVTCAQAFSALTDGSPITFATGGRNISNRTVTLAHTTSTRALNISGLVSGAYFTIVATQDSTGGAAMTGGTGCTWYVSGVLSTALIPNTAASTQTTIVGAYDGTNCYTNPSTSSSSVTSVATTSPLGGGPITGTGTLTCTTCVTSAASLTNNALMAGAGSQGAQTITTGTGVNTALGVNTGSAGAFGVLVGTGTAAMGTSAISSGACATVVTTAVTGVATTDVIEVGFNGDPTAVTGYGASSTGAVLTIYPYPSSGNVNIKVCNSTASSITPGALTLNFKVYR
jgi:hypothetical protein